MLKWKDWEPKYREIVKRLNLSVEDDRSAAHKLKNLISNFDSSKLRNLIGGKECIVFGAGPSLEKDLDLLDKKGWLEKILISADGATSAVMNYRYPDVIVTDLDGVVEDQLEAWKNGAWMVVHAHGDNIKQIRKVVPELNERVLGSIQVNKPDELNNFGGFTDGDRAAFLADYFDASKIYLAGMNLGTKIGKYTGKTNVSKKIEKLDICKELLSWLSSNTGTPIVNITFSGQNIPKVPEENLEEL